MKVKSVVQFKFQMSLLLLLAMHIKRLVAMHIPVADMMHAKVKMKANIVTTGAWGLTVGDWM